MRILSSRLEEEKKLKDGLMPINSIKQAVLTTYTDRIAKKVESLSKAISLLEDSAIDADVIQ